MLFQFLERAHGPHAVCFVPEYDADDSAENADKQVFPHEEILCEEKQISRVENCGENRVEKVSWKQQFSKFHVVAEYADFHFAD